VSIALALHVLSAVIWVGGMFFAYVCLRPAAAALLEPADRLKLWGDVFARFFPYVIVAIVVLIVSGHGLIALYGGFAAIGKHVHLMLASGYVMVALFLHVYFAPFKRLKRFVAEENWSDAAHNLNQIRKLVGINLLLGLLTVAVGSGGRFLFV